MGGAYYNEWEAFPATWLCNLMAAGKITNGRVDQRSIKDVQGADLVNYDRVHLFAGIAGWELALELAGWPKDLPVWTGSCPCQPFSTAGKGKGTDDERHLWPEMLRLIADRRPPVVFGEQVASKLGRVWLSAVRADLEALGYAVGAADLGAAGVGAPHIRQRLWWVAWRSEGVDYTKGHGRAERPDGGRSETTGVQPPESGVAVGARCLDIGRGAPDPAGMAHGDSSRRGPGRSGEAGDGRDSARLELAGLRADGAGNPWAAPEWLPCSDGGVGNASDAGLPQQQRVGSPLREAGCRVEGQAVERTGTQINPWASPEWLPCSDGKARPTQPGLFPLAHGVPGRVGQLRAAGNAIVPQVAAAFIAAFINAQGIK